MELKKLGWVLKPKDYSKVLASSCTNSPKTLSFRVSDNDHHDVLDETVIRGAHSESTRLFFDPSVSRDIFRASPIHQADEDINNKKKKAMKKCAIDEETSQVGVVAIDSEDPYLDFRLSMEEMVAAEPWILHGWDSLEHVLACYLTLNAPHTRPFIVAAFVHLLISHSLLL